MYVSNVSFGGQRATIGRVVVVGTERGPRVGIVVLIDEVRGVALFVPPVGQSATFEGADHGYTFVPTSTPAEVDALPPLSWTWPPRV